jgi:hypothetical protein
VSRRAARNRHRAAKARMGPPPAQGKLTLSTSQVQALLAAGQQSTSGQLAVPLPRPPAWAGDPFAPGSPLVPAPINRRRPDTGRAEPRLFELPISTNINIGTAPYVPWRILKEAADMPLFRKCIERRKSVCQLGYTVTVDPRAVAREAALSGQHEKDVEAALRDKYTADITRISDWLTEPDRGNGHDWQQWASLLFENRLKYDATVIYPHRTYGGDVFSFEVIDGSTIKPLLDERGGRPVPPYPFCQQILYGFPRGEFIADARIGDDGQPFIPGGYAADQLLYERTIIRPETPYGLSATEIALLDGIVWMRRMGWILAEYTEGMLPKTIVETDNEVEWSVTQWEDWLRAMNDHLAGSDSARNKFTLFPPGTHPLQTAEVAERYKPDYDLLLIKLVAGDFGLPASELGFTEPGALGASFHEGEEDILYRQTRLPDTQWLGAVTTKLCRRQLGMPPVLSVQILGLESEDEAAADEVAENQVRSGRMTLNQDNARRGEPPYDFDEADMPMLMGQRGVVFLEGASKLAPPGTMIEPATAQAGPGADDGTGDGTPPGKARTKRAPQGANGQVTAKAAAEAAAFRAWARKGPRSRPFACTALTKALALSLAPDLVGDERIVFKAGDGPKALAGTGPAGRGTCS